MSERERHAVTCPRCKGTGEVLMTGAERLGHNLLRIRRERGWTQRDLAREVGIGRTQIANIESGRSGTSLDNLLEMAAKLGVCISDLFVTPTEEQPHE